MDIADVKRNMNRLINYKGNTDTYMMTGCMLRRSVVDGQFWYQAELTDVKARCLLYDGLEKIKEI